MAPFAAHNDVGRVRGKPCARIPHWLWSSNIARSDLSSVSRIQVDGAGLAGAGPANICDRAGDLKPIHSKFSRAQSVESPAATEEILLRIEQASKLGNQVQEDTLIIRAQIRQIIREFAKVIPHTQHQVIADMAIRSAEQTKL